LSQSISTYLAPCQAARHHIAMLSPGWSQTIGFAGASEPLPNVVCPRRASRFGPSHKEYADDCRAGDVIRDPLRQAAEFAVVFRRDEPAHRASGVDAAPRVYGCRFLSSATRQSSHRAEGAPPALVPGDCADEFAHQLAPISHSPRSIVDKAPRREAVRGPLHQYGARGRKPRESRASLVSCRPVSRGGGRRRAALHQQDEARGRPSRVRAVGNARPRRGLDHASLGQALPVTERGYPA